MPDSLVHDYAICLNNGLTTLRVLDFNKALEYIDKS